MRPGRAEVVNVGLGGLLADSCDDAVNLGLRSAGFNDFIRFFTDVDDDLTVGKVLRKNVRVRMRALGNLPGVAVPEKDLAFAGILVLDGGEGECYRCHNSIFC